MDGTKMGGKKLYSLVYANDIVLLAEEEESYGASVGNREEDIWKGLGRRVWLTR